MDKSDGTIFETSFDVIAHANVRNLHIRIVNFKFHYIGVYLPET